MVIKIKQKQMPIADNYVCTVMHSSGAPLGIFQTGIGCELVLIPRIRGYHLPPQPPSPFKNKNKKRKLKLRCRMSPFLLLLLYIVGEGEG